MSKLVKENVVLVTAGTPSANGVVYTKSSLKAAIEKGMLYGELAPEFGQNISKALTVNLGEIATQVSDLRMDGDALIGTVTVLDTPYGQALQSALAAANATPANISFGLRGVGTKKGKRVSLQSIVSIDAIAVNGPTKDEESGT